MSEYLESLRIPAFCPVCKWMMKGPKSVGTYYDWGCCIDCYIEFLDSRPAKKDAWKGGWRPSEEQIQAFREQ